MPFGIRQVANSADPRDWHYLEHWQTWAGRMPPIAYRWSSPGSCPLGHFLDLGTYVPPPLFFPFGWKHDFFWFDYTSIDIGDPPVPFFTKTVWMKIVVYDPNEPLPLDPDGVPYNWALRIEIYDSPFTYTVAQAYAIDTPYDAVIHLAMLDGFGMPNPLFPNGITLTPVPWDTPVTRLTEDDLCT